MAERLRAIWNRIVEWWKKFTRGQKTVIISITAVVVVALLLLAFVVTRPNYEVLISASNYSEAKQVMDLLDAEGIGYKYSDDGMIVSVKDTDLAKAHLVLGTNDIQADGYAIEDVFDGSFSTTESDKEKKYILYLEEKLASELVATQTAIDSAAVTLSMPDNDGTILSQQEDAYVSVLLTLNTELDEDACVGIAQFLATAVGNDDTDNVLLLDSNSTVLFSGSDSSSVYGGTSSQIAIRTKAETNIKSQVKDILMGSGLYDNVQIGLSLDMDFDQKTISDLYYYTTGDNTQGLLDSSATYNEETQGGAGAVPGTDSNNEDGTTYVIQDSENTYSIIEETNYDYLPNQTLTETVKAIGTVEPANSSISVVATKYIVYNEDEMTASGQLADVTFDEFIAANSDMVEVDVDDEYYTLISNATGIPTESISIISYEIPFFQASEQTSAGIADYLQFILAGAILLMLGFVIFRSTRSATEEVEIEPELSVESLLESTKNEELEDIGYNEKSETRLLIEKFVDENPEAVANLLRNWLNEDEWG